MSRSPVRDALQYCRTVVKKYIWTNIHIAFKGESNGCFFIINPVKSPQSTTFNKKPEAAGLAFRKDEVPFAKTFSLSGGYKSAVIPGQPEGPEGLHY